MISPIETWIIVGLFIGHGVEGKTFTSEPQCIEYRKELQAEWEDSGLYRYVVLLTCRRKK